MSVNENKTLVKVRTFAKDFAAHKPDAPHQEATTEPDVPKIKPAATPKAQPPTPLPTPPAKKERPSLRIKKSPSKPVVNKKVELKETAPAHHESHLKMGDLQKEIAKVQQTSAVETKLPHTAHSTPTQSNKKPARVPTGPATVITATKRSSGRASSHSIIDQIIKWFRDLKKNQRQKKTPTYTVEQTTRRKGVIQKATTKSGALFTADNETLREAILRRRTTQSDELELTWSPNTDPGFNLLESPDAPEIKGRPHNIQVAFKQRTVAKPPVTTPAEPVTTWESQEPPTPAPAQKPVTPPEPEPQPEPEPTPEPLAPPEPEPQPITPVQSPVTPEAAPTQSEPEPIPTTPKPRVRISLPPLSFGQLSTNALTMLIIGIIATTVLAVIITRAVYGLFATEEPIVWVEPSAPILPGVTVIDLKLENYSRSDLLTAVAQSHDFAQGSVQEFRFKQPDGTLLIPASLIELLGLELTPSFAQSIENAHLIIINGVDRGLLLTTGDPITALGGMLQWEENMLNDLSEFFNLPTSQTISTKFIDDIYGATDVRILTNGSEVLLIYGFIGENTLLITDNSEAFRQIEQTNTVY